MGDDKCHTKAESHLLTDCRSGGDDDIALKESDFCTNVATFNVRRSRGRSPVKLPPDPSLGGTTEVSVEKSKVKRFRLKMHHFFEAHIGQFYILYCNF